MNILMTGDVVGESGRRAVNLLLPALRDQYKLDLVVVNAENADGLGLYISSAQDLLDNGADILTLGDHIYDKFEIYDYLAKDDRIVRPLNFSPAIPGKDRIMVKIGPCRVMVVSVLGLLKINIYSSLSPFTALDHLLSELETLPDEKQPHIILVDFHAEDIQEKQALGWYVDGRVSAVVGTHTHVPTLDARILPGGTGKVTDIGMCGPRDGSLGMKLDAALTRFVSGMPSRYTLAPGPVQFNAVFLQINEKTGRCQHIERVDRLVNFTCEVEETPLISGSPTSSLDSQALT
ncbi:MAG TPA: TIGR00282 family metallophosphoesterase [Chloroflexia bacterium]|nr:TIGR00282 family metallophosphoesterase [Chloroflexia bacterium]